MDTAVVASVLLALLLYINTLPADFAYDDSRAILKNPDLQNDSPLVNLFYNDFWGTPLTHSGSHKSYRPLCVLTFRLNHYLGGLQPFGYHLGNVLLHAVVTGLFAHVARLLLRRPVPTLVAGLLFASHPIHTEAVAGVVGRADILACLFFLLAFLSYMRYCKYRDKPGGDLLCSNHVKSNNIGNSKHSPNAKSSHKQYVTLDRSVRWRYLVATAVLTAMSMLSKEQGITVLAICVTYDVFLHSRISVMQLPNILRGRHKGVLEGIASLAVMGVSFLSLRVYFMGNKPPEFAPADNPASDSDSQLTRALTFTYLPFFNFWLLLFPTTLSFDWSMEAIPLLTSLSDPRNLYCVIFYSVLVYGIWYLLCNLNVERSERLHNGNGFASHINSTGNGSHNNHNSHVVSHRNSSGLRKRLSSRRGSNSSSNSDSDDSSSDTRRLYSTKCKPLHVLTISLALVVFPFLPATNIFFYVGFVVAERVLYMPSMGFCLLVAEGAYLMWSRYCNKSQSSNSNSSGQRGKSAAGRHLQGGGDPGRKTVFVVGLALLVGAYSVRTVLRNQDWLTEENLYKAGISVNPAKAWGNLANILNNQGRTSEAEQAYRSALRHRGNMADVHYNLGILLQEQKRYQEAIDSYLMAIKCRPRLTMAYLNLGIVYGIVGKKEEASKMYRQCVEIDTAGLKDPRLHEHTKISALYNLGRLLADQEHYQEAIDVYKEAIQRRPSHYAPQSLYNMLGEAYAKLDDLDKAEYWYKEALAAKEDHIPAHLTMAKLASRRGRAQEAEAWFSKAMKIDPSEGSIYQHYGQYLGEVGRYTEAADNYVRATQVTQEDFELIFNTANALRQANRNIDAEKFYKRAAKLRPNEATAHMNLGAMLHFNGKLEEAEQSYLMALKLKPDDSITRTNLNKLRNLINKNGGGSK